MTNGGKIGVGAVTTAVVVLVSVGLYKPEQLGLWIGIFGAVMGTAGAILSGLAFGRAESAREAAESAKEAAERRLDERRVQQDMLPALKELCRDVRVLTEVTVKYGPGRSSPRCCVNRLPQA